MYVVQPYRVGSATGKSLAIIIPAELAKEYNIDRSTILALRVDDRREKIIMKMIVGTADRHEKMTPTGESFEASNQQVSSGSQ